MNRRRLSDDEHALWQGVTRSIAPLRQRKRQGSPTSPPSGLTAEPVRAKPKAKPIALAAPAALPVPAPVRLGRRARQRIARGAQPVDGRLDLHGLTQAQAHNALLGFLRAKQARGGRIVLVITGKGGGDPYGERGVLKRQVPLWLRLPEFRNLVAGFEPAGIGHGGEGALYISLRKARPGS